MLKDIGIALSLANLCFFSVWSELLPGALRHYFMEEPPAREHFPALILNVLALATAFWVGRVLQRGRFSSRLSGAARWMFLIAALVALNGVRVQFPQLSLSKLAPRSAGPVWFILGVLLGLLGVSGLFRWNRRIIRAAVAVVLMLLPFVVLTFSQALWSGIKYEAAFAEFGVQPLAQLVKPPDMRGPRVLWLLFDELDQRVTFEARPINVKMPEIERLRKEAVYATDAYPPAGSSMLSIPALITGRVVLRGQPERANELLITFGDTRHPVGWSTQPNIFGEARAFGMNSALIGWYHPYCRLIGSSLTTCSWYSHPVFSSKTDPGGNISRRMLNQVFRLVDRLPLVRRIGLEKLFGGDREKQERELHLTHYLSMLAQAKEAATDPKLNLIFVHWPIPHLPGIYNRGIRAFSVDGNVGYLDNLELVDHTLGELRRAMEAAGMWEDTTILLTADHWWLSSLEFDGKVDHRVPFILKLRGQNRETVYSEPFNSALAYELTLDVLRGNVSSVHSIVTWLDTHRSRRPAEPVL